MGYSNQTPNFGLPQYAMGDIPTMDDYNRSFRVIDENLGKSSGGGTVESVNGQTGTVVIDAEDVGAIPNMAGAVQTGNIADKSITAEKLSDDIVIRRIPKSRSLSSWDIVTELRWQ